VSDIVAEQKAVLRRKLREEAQRHSAAERAAASHDLCELVHAQAPWRTAKAVLFYMPLPGEVDIRELMNLAFLEGKSVALPRYSVEQGRYLPCQVGDVSTSLCAGAYGIAEPSVECPIADPNRLDLLLIPGVGFSFNGRRLGRGKGHYDRLLAEVQGQKCGVAFDWQVTVEVPAERHDILLNYIVTPTRWHTVAS